jgi:class 3 adenylate cyclase
LEEQMADVKAVLDAASSSRTAVLGQGDGAMMAVMFAATHPERVTHLVLFHGMARVTATDGYEWAPSEEERIAQLVDPVFASWGSGEMGRMLAPVFAARDPRLIEWWGRWERLSGSPETVRPHALLSSRMDVRDILPQVQAPTLVLDRPNAHQMDSRHSRYLADHIPGAELRELPGGDTTSIGDGSEAFVEAIREFVTGTKPRHDATRALSTVMFTDIVASTERASELGDARWRQLLERHDGLSRERIAEHAGRAVKATGDGFLATFDGPARAVRCASALAADVRDLGIELRAGVHTGEVELVEDDVAGMAVHIGARIGALGGAGEVLASSTVRDLVVGSGIEFEERGTHELKGVPGEWQLFAVA